MTPSWWSLFFEHSLVSQILDISIWGFLFFRHCSVGGRLERGDKKTMQPEKTWLTWLHIFASLRSIELGLGKSDYLNMFLTTIQRLAGFSARRRV